MQVDLHISQDIPQAQASETRTGLAALDGYRDLPPLHPRVALRRSVELGGPVYLADASVVIDGRRFVAYASGDTALAASTEAVDRLGAKVRRARDRMLVPRDWFDWAQAARRGWRWEGDTLTRELRFRDFDEGLSLLEEIGWRAEDHKRHPDLSIAGNRLRLRIANPHRAGITLAELRLAAKVDAVIDQLTGPAARA